MEKRIEKWESLRLDIQKFTPQEYCDGACWVVTLQCQGQSDSQGHKLRYVYDASGTTELGDMHADPHHSQHSIEIFVHTEDSSVPDIDNYEDVVGSSEGINDFHLSRARSTSGHEWFDGWAWFVPGSPGDGIHFATVPTFARYQPRPQHS